MQSREAGITFYDPFAGRVNDGSKKKLIPASPYGRILFGYVTSAAFDVDR